MVDLLRRLRALAPDGMVVASADLTLPPLPLWPGETIPPSVASRQREFAAGRAAVRSGLAAMAEPPVAIPVGPDRVPIWPRGIAGSISHCAGACMAVLAETRVFAAVGLDLEPKMAIDPDLWPIILQPEESAAVRSLSPDLRGLQVLQVFVAKEAAFKAQFMLSRALIGFDALQIEFAGQDFAARFRQKVPPFAADATICGKWLTTDGYVAAIAWVSPGENADAAEMRTAQEIGVKH